MNDTFVITGDRGFVGGRLRNQLLQEGHQVIGLGRTPAVAELPGYQPLVVDLSDRGAVLAVAEKLRGAKAVFHLAARNPGGDDDPVGPHLAGNLRSAENLLEALDGAAAPLVLSSTLSVYGLPPRRLPVGEDQSPQPTGAYGLSKLAAEYAGERMARAGRVACIVLRYPGVFGPGSSAGAIALYASQVFAGKPASPYGRGLLLRDYVHVDDVVAANRLAAEAALRLGWGRYHISGGCPMRLVEVARLVVEAAGHGTVETNDRPAPFDFAFDISRARAELGYRPPPLRQRIGEYIAELRQNATQRSA